MDTTQYLLEAASFTRLGDSKSGVVDVSDLLRATEDLPEQQGQKFSWSVQGELDTAGRRFIHLRITGFIILECQRCLKPFEHAVNVLNSFEIVDTETELELDEDDFEGSDRILATQRLNLLELIEDEIILALPYVARHEVCPSLPDVLSGNDEPDLDTEKPNPFAVLSKLKKS